MRRKPHAEPASHHNVDIVRRRKMTPEQQQRVRDEDWLRLVELRSLERSNYERKR